ncbi:MAG: AzlC family ABC transporter permease [Pararhizobium sp.]
MISSSRQGFLGGAVRAVPIVISTGPFAVLFGALAVSHGMTLGETFAMSAIVFAGASQMVGIELFGSHVAPWLIVVSIFAVNFRHVLYSAAVGRKLDRFSGLQKAVGFFFLTDPQFAEAERRIGSGQPVGFAWYMGVALPMYVAWVGLTMVGALFGGLLRHPEAWGIDFLLPVYFLGLVMDFRHRPNWLPVVAASAVGSVVAFRLVGSPWHVTLGALAGIAVAVFLPSQPRPIEEEAADAAAEGMRG